MKMWWLNVALQLCFFFFFFFFFFFHGAYSKSTSFRKSLRGANSFVFSSAHSPINLTTENSKKVVINNGIVSVSIARPGGYVIGISYAGINNLLEARNKETNRGYFDVVYGGDPRFSNSSSRIHGKNFSVITEEDNIVEVSFLSTWTSSMGNIPINIDQRYILRSGDSGFYSYVIFERPEGYPAVNVSQIRTVFKLDKKRFNYMAISDTRQRRMPSARDRKMGKTLAYPEAVLLTHPSNPRFQGEVDDKYQYSSENQHNLLNGWISADAEKPVGFWIITPSNEFRNGGPIKQDLTSHVGPICLSMFVSHHYGGREVSVNFQEGETYTKVFGPIFIHLNSASNKTKYRSLWSEAKEQLSKEVNSWPYDFPKSKAFVPPIQRGTIIGRLHVHEWGEKSQYASNAYVGLASPGDAGSWQIESKGYQFWTRTDTNGNFVITNIVPGEYNLYAWVPGYIGDYMYNDQITVTTGCTINFDSLVYYPPRNGPNLWEIGIPNRSAKDLFVPSPNPKFPNKLYKNDNRDRFRQYGLWARYTDLYPNDDLVYMVGVSDYRKDWFFAHVPRILEEKKLQATTWKVNFELQSNVSIGNYTLQLALASACYAEIQVWFNDWSSNPSYFTTKRIGEDNAIARHGNHGLYFLFSIDVPSYHLVKGNNTLFLRQSRTESLFYGVMYDYIRLESPSIQAS